jgi:hypothetical protein
MRLKEATYVDLPSVIALPRSLSRMEPAGRSLRWSSTTTKSNDAKVSEAKVRLLVSMLKMAFRRSATNKCVSRSCIEWKGMQSVGYGIIMSI